MSEAGLRLRPATDADAAAVRELVFGVLREYGLQPDPEGADQDLSGLEAAYGAAGGAFCVLVTGDGAVVGSAGLRPVSEAGPRGSIELRKMYLRRDHRGRGEGRRLLEWALGEARRLGFRRITLETATPLREAIRLYEKAGFRRVDGSPGACRCDRVMERAL